MTIQSEWPAYRKFACDHQHNANLLLTINQRNSNLFSLRSNSDMICSECISRVCTHQRLHYIKLQATCKNWNGKCSCISAIKIKRGRCSRIYTGSQRQVARAKYWSTLVDAIPQHSANLQTDNPTWLMQSVSLTLIWSPLKFIRSNMVNSGRCTQSAYR